jgi:hypothetical protein
MTKQAETHLEIGGILGASPVALCGTKTRTNPLQFFRGFDPSLANWNGTFVGPTCGKCFYKISGIYYEHKEREARKAATIAMNRCRSRPRHQEGLCTCYSNS